MFRYVHVEMIFYFIFKESGDENPVNGNSEISQEEVKKKAQVDGE